MDERVMGPTPALTRKKREELWWLFPLSWCFLEKKCGLEKLRVTSVSVPLIHHKGGWGARPIQKVMWGIRDKTLESLVRSSRLFSKPSWHLGTHWCVCDLLSYFLTLMLFLRQFRRGLWVGVSGSGQSELRGGLLVWWWFGWGCVCVGGFGE